MTNVIIQHDDELVSRDYLKQELNRIISEYPVRWSTKIRKTPSLLNAIKFYTPLLNADDFEYSLPTMVYWILNDIDSFPIYTCPVDGVQKILRHVNVLTLADGYKHFLESPGCCPRCIKLNPKIKKKCEETSMRKHGEPHFNNAKKAAITSKERYGEKLKTLVERRNNTCKRLYGRIDGGNSSQACEKRRQTNLKKRGVEYVSQDESVKRKKEQTYMKNLGVRNPSMSSSINAKRRKRWILYWDNFEVYQIKKTTDKPDRDYLNSARFDSLCEIQVFLFCGRNNLDCNYQPSISFNYEYAGKSHIYHPDFIIQGKLYEVKGNQFFKMNDNGAEIMICPYRNKTWTDEYYAYQCGIYEAKHQCMIANNVIILRENDVKNLSLQTFGIEV